MSETRYSIAGDALSLAKEIGFTYLQNAARTWLQSATPMTLGAVGLAIILFCALILRPLFSLLWRLFWKALLLF